MYNTPNCRYIAKYGSIENEVNSKEEGETKFGDRIEDYYKYPRMAAFGPSGASTPGTGATPTPPNGGEGT